MAYIGKALPVELVGSDVAASGLSIPMYIKGGTASFKLGTTPTQTAAGQADGGGIALTTSRASGFEVDADTGGTNLNGDYYVAAIRGYFVHGTADSNSSEIAVLGSFNNNTAAFGSGDKYAVRGHMDIWGNTSLTGANVNVGAVSAYLENEATTTVDAGNVLCGLQVYQVTNKPTLGAGTYPAGGINPAIWIRAGASAAWQTGLYMPVNSVSTGIRIGNWVGSGASGSAIPFTVATQNVYSDGQLSVVAAFGESTSNLTSAYNAHVGRFRHIATGSSLTVAQETYGLVGQMCAKGVTLTHLHAGLMGTFEGTGASVVLNSSYTLGGHAAVTARVGGHTNITATTPLAGFLAFNNGSANLASGTLSAFATSVYSTSYPWSIGLYVPAGTALVGAELLNTLTPDSTRSNAYLMLGATRNGTAANITMAASTSQHVDPIQMNLNIAGSAPTSTSTVNGFYQLITHSTTNMANYLRLKGCDWTIDVRKHLQDAYTIQGELDISTNAVTIGGEAAAMGLTTSVTSAPTGNVWTSVMVFNTDQVLTTAANLFLSNRGTGTIPHALYIEANSGTTLTDAIYLNAAGTVTNFLAFNAVAAPVSTSATALNGITTSHKLACRIGGVTVYIPLITSGMS